MSPEESLDPENWNEMRRLGHRMVDDAMDYLERVRERPVWQPVGDAAKAALRAPLPVKGQGPAAVYEDFLRDVFPNGMGNIHPRFWGWVIGTGTPFGALADMLASTMNPNIGGGDQGPNYVELQTLSWLREMLGYPAESLRRAGGSRCACASAITGPVESISTSSCARCSRAAAPSPPNRRGGRDPGLGVRSGRPSMRPAFPLTAALLAVLLVAGCSSTHPSGGKELMRDAIDVPTHFLVLTPRGTAVEPVPGSCKNPLIDPRDQTKIVLVRSSEDRGYYRVPPGRYGVGGGELLLVECGTGRVMGIVKR